MSESDARSVGACMKASGVDHNDKGDASRRESDDDDDVLRSCGGGGWLETSSYPWTEW